MRTNIQKWGNSLALRIPKLLAERAHLTRGSLVEIRFVDDIIQIEPVVPQAYSLETLLERVSEQNVPDEFDSGKARGKEVW